MPERSSNDALTERHYVSAILRLVVGRQGQLAYGELVGIDGTSQGYFRNWRGLTRCVREWLSRQPLDST